MTTVESWTELLKHPIVTAEHSNGENRIAAATDILQQTAQRFAQVLNERTKLLANSAQFDTALCDAAAIRALLPGSGLEYLCTGDVYCQQGHHAAAISIYDAGLEAVSESDPYYHQLQQQRLAAITSNNKRVDFISQLPFDIVITNIVPRMQPEYYTESSCKLLYISRSWQERIVKQPNGLKFIFDKEGKTLKKGHAQLIQFAPHVQTLSGPLSKGRLDDLFSRARFSNLKQLHMTCTPKTPPLPFIRGLRLIGDSLTHLDISKGPGLQLCDIMEACPNLLFLKADNVNAIMPLPSSSSYSLLQYLSLDRQRQQTLEHEDMVDFLRRFPSLRTLQISPMPNTTVLPILHKHCPYLHEISLGHPSPNLGVLSANDHSNRKGIRSAYLGGERSYCRDSLIEFLYAQRDSLETFNFYGEHKIENASWKLSADGRIENDPLSPFSLTRLVHLEFKEFDPYQNMSMMKWIVLNAPNLNAIEIFNVHFTRDIAKTLIKSQHLRKVQVDHNFEKAMEDSFIDNSDRGIHQFFEDHAALGDRSTLEHMAVEMALMDEFEHRWVDLLSRLPCLKVLELHHPYSHADYAMANRFKAVVERICRKCPALEKLTINGECRDGWRSDEASDSPSSSRSSWSSYESYMDYY